MHVVKMLLSLQHCTVRIALYCPILYCTVLCCTILRYSVLRCAALSCPILSILLEEGILIFSTSTISRRLSLCHIILYIILYILYITLPFSFNFISFSLLHFSIKLFLFQIKNWWFFFIFHLRIFSIWYLFLIFILACFLLFWYLIPDRVQERHWWPPLSKISHIDRLMADEKKFKK